MRKLTFVCSVGALVVGCTGPRAVGSTAPRSVEASIRNEPLAKPSAHAVESSTSCSTSWSLPQTLHTRIGAPVHIDPPSNAIPIGNGFLIVGSRVTFGLALPDTSGPPPTPSELDPATAFGGLALLNGLTRLVERPEFLRSNSTVWIFPLGERGFQVIWGVPQDTASRWPAVTSVWYAQFDGERWERPELVMKAQSIEWSYATSAAIVSNDQVIVAAPTRDSLWTGILTSHRTPSGWMVERIGVRAAFSPVGVALVVARGRPLLFYRDDTTRIAALPKGVAMYFRELQVGKPWSVERFAYPLSPGGINWPLAVATPDGQVHVVWAFTRNGEHVETIEHLSTHDLSTWRRDGLPLGARAFGLTVAPDGESSIQMIVQTSLFDNVGSVRWTPKGFSRLEEVPFVSSIGPSPSLARLATDTLLMAWTTIATFEFKKHAAPFLVTMISRGTRSCQ